MAVSERVSRRRFICVLAVTGGALSVMSRLGLASAGRSSMAGSSMSAALAESACASAATPVLSFHLDSPYLDFTGTGQPFVPPAGARSAAPLAALVDALGEDVLCRYYGSI